MRKAAILLCVLAIAAVASPRAQAAGCGPLSTWTGKVCIGPRGKAYCPLDMTMEGGTCVAAATPQSLVVRPPGSPNGRFANGAHPLLVPAVGAVSGKVKFGAGLQPFIAQLKLTEIVPTEFTLTPNHPEIPGSGDLEFKNSNFYSDDVNLGFADLVNPDTSEDSIISKAILFMGAVAGTTYAVDVTVSRPVGATGACEALFMKPDGSESSLAVTVQTPHPGELVEQHLVAIFQATYTGPTPLQTVASCEIYVWGVTVATLQ